MPFTMIAFGLASLSMIGVPPVSGFVTKWFLALGTLDIHNMILLTVILVSSLLNAGYFVPVFYTSFFRQTAPGDNPSTGSFLKASPLIMFMVIPLFFTAVASVMFGVYPDLFLNIINLMVAR